MNVKVSDICPILTKLSFSRQIFVEVPNYIKSYVNPCGVRRADTCGWTERQTNRHDEANRRFLRLCERA